MKKRLLLFVLLQLTGPYLFGQNSSEDLSMWYNSLKSASKAVDKETYILKILTINAGADQPQTSFLIDASLQIVAIAFAEEGDLKKALVYTAKIKDTELKSSTEDGIAESLTTQKKYQQAHAILDSKVSVIKKDSNGTRLPEKNQMMTAMIYGGLLFCETHYLEASDFLAASMTLNNYGENYKEDYLRALIRGNSKKADRNLISEIYLMKGRRSDAFRQDVKSWFVKTDGNSNAFNALDEQASEQEKNRLESVVAKMAVNQPAPDFEVLDMNGNKVALSSFRGKTVILDFWATWCQPCVASFPGMQKAVNYYKNDTSVVFMFIHTMEKKGADVKKQSQDLLKAKGYNFDIYMDLKDPVTGKSPAAEKFNVRGIPAKFVINREGIIKFSNGGYVSEDEAVEEIKLMVEKANQK
ncbi:TlpA family protein disulfide reductase [Flavobacterium notoginsengisoli]|uniref:TlpA family protein disulfide reductase n=1 Tax=Flavobacterium notoginsengisoli TaxID=1478199 RepID=UPI0036332BFA